MQSIEISINGKRAVIPQASPLDAALRQSGYALEYAAVAVNEAVVPRTQYTSRLLQEGDRVEVVTPFAGG